MAAKNLKAGEFNVERSGDIVTITARIPADKDARPSSSGKTRILVTSGRAVQVDPKDPSVRLQLTMYKYPEKKGE